MNTDDHFTTPSPFRADRYRTVVVFVWTFLAAITAIWEYIHHGAPGIGDVTLWGVFHHVVMKGAVWLIGLWGILSAFRRISVVVATLTAERDNLRSVFGATPMPMLLFDDRMEAVLVNSAFRDYCADFEALPDKRCGTILRCANALSDSLGCGNLPACESCRLMRSLREVSRSGLPSRGEAAVKRVGADGEETEACLLYGVEVVTLNGKAHLLMSFADISERKESERALQERERELRALTDNSPDAIARYDRQCRLLYVNPAQVRLAGKQAELLIGEDPLEGFATNPEAAYQIATSVRHVLERGAPVEIELSWKAADGTMQHFLLHAVPEYDADGKAASVLCVSRDITSLRKTEAHLRHAQKMDTVGTLAGGVAHDFNNLLTVVGGYAELLKLSLSGDEQRLSYVREISDAVTRGSELTRSLLTFSGKRETVKQYDDLNRIVANLQRIISRLLRSDITINFQLCTRRLPVFVDRVQIEQVLINLLVNARDALVSGGRIDVATAFVARDEGATGDGDPWTAGYCLVTVSDNGIGMDGKTATRIFEPFFTTKGAGDGTGLGLAIAYGIVGHHCGRISVESAPGKGSSFRVYLPIFQGVAQPEPAPEPETTDQRGDEVVLVVDDEPNVLKLSRELLTRQGYTVLTAADGVEALELYAAHRDVIRMVAIDMIMPRMNGRETIERIRQQDAALPIMLMSGYTDDVIRRSDLETLDVVVLQKPVPPRKLAAAIRAALG